MAWQFFASSGKEKVIQETVPAGLIVPFGGTVAPGGWLLCQGQEVSRATYPRLDAAIGTNYGAYTNGSGSAGTTHIRLPDLRGRTPVGRHAGAGNRTDTNGPLTGTGQITGGSAIAEVTIGAWSGVESLTLTAAQSGIKQHNHGASVAAHGHGVNNTSHQHGIGYQFGGYTTGATTRAQPSGGNQALYNSGSGGISPTSDTKSSGYSTTRSNTAVDAAGSHSNMAPSLVINFMIRAL